MNKFDRDEFANRVCRELYEISGKKFTFKNVIKNNNVSQTGIMLDEKNQITPCLYIDNAYKEYCENDEFNFTELCDTIYESYMDRINAAPQFDIDSFMKFENVKDKIYATMVGVNLQKDFFADKPFKKVADDLVCVYRCQIDNSIDGKASFVITDEQLAAWNITKDELHAVAVENTPKLDPPKFRKLSEILSEMMGIPMEMLENSNVPTIYCITNQSGINGAGLLVNEDVRTMITDTLGDCYVLPSSVHECLCISKDTDMSLSDFKEMVKAVNGDSSIMNQVDILSDNVYELNGKKLKLAKEETINREKNMKL